MSGSAVGLRGLFSVTVDGTRSGGAGFVPSSGQPGSEGG